jgi:hypothetical protein
VGSGRTGRPSRNPWVRFGTIEAAAEPNAFTPEVGKLQATERSRGLVGRLREQFFREQRYAESGQRGAGETFGPLT